MSDEKLTRERPARRQRTPIGTGNVLVAEQRPGYVRRFVNDTNGRVERFIAAGYEPVHSASADLSNGRMKPSSMGDSVIRKPVGGGISAVLMEIPEEFYEEDQAAKQRDVDRIEASLQPRIPAGQTSSEGQYGHVQIG